MISMMPTTNTKLVWSSTGDYLAYIQNGLHVYVMGSELEPCEHVFLSRGDFSDLSWSPNGRLLTARQTDGQWRIYRMSGLRVRLIFEVYASSLEWLDNHRILYVPDEGGLVLVDLSANNNKVVLAG